jgi:3-isopropylmalate/(R)-2-methylmalate dehydratase small subunit
MSAAPLVRLTAIAAPLLRDNVNTDAIIPSREMKSVSRQGLADGLFAEWRYTNVGGREPDATFVLNDPRYSSAQILIAGANFGCGSSREHAAWALAEYGFRAVIAESFNPIFRGNAVLNGIAPIVLARDALDILAQLLDDAAGPLLTIDLDTMVLVGPDGRKIGFVLDEDARAMLRQGLDMIDLTFQHRDAITAFRASDRLLRPWAYME